VKARGCPTRGRYDRELTLFTVPQTLDRKQIFWVEFFWTSIHLTENVFLTLFNMFNVLKPPDSNSLDLQSNHAAILLPREQTFFIQFHTKTFKSFKINKPKIMMNNLVRFNSKAFRCQEKVLK
jgi:hypothetical protein